MSNLRRVFGSRHIVVVLLLLLLLLQYPYRHKYLDMYDLKINNKEELYIY